MDETPTLAELLDAQRFYRMSFPLSVVPAQNAGVAGAVCAIAPIANSQPSAYLPFSPPMNAASPTVTLYNPSAANTNWRNITAVADGPASSVVSKDGSGVLIDGTAAIATGGQQVCIHYTADGGL